MLTDIEVEKFADWIIKQQKKIENQILDQLYPISEEIQNMSDDELLKELLET